MSNSSSGNVGIVIVSHSAKIAEGAADMVRQMVGNAVPLAWTGGDLEGGLGTNVAGRGLQCSSGRGGRDRGDRVLRRLAANRGPAQCGGILCMRSTPAGRPKLLCR
jgi:hypothetical protein